MKVARIIIIALLLIVSVSALIAGYLFMLDPSGSKLGLSVDILEHSPFENFLLPGIVLFVLNGILNLIAAMYAIFQWKGWMLLVLLQGFVLFAWIAIQAAMLQRLHYLHFIFSGIGVILMLFSVSSYKPFIRKKNNPGVCAIKQL